MIVEISISNNNKGHLSQVITLVTVAERRTWTKLLALLDNVRHPAHRHRQPEKLLRWQAAAPEEEYQQTEEFLCAPPPAIKLYNSTVGGIGGQGEDAVPRAEEVHWCIMTTIIITITILIVWIHTKLFISYLIIRRTSTTIYLSINLSVSWLGHIHLLILFWWLWDAGQHFKVDIAARNVREKSPSRPKARLTNTRIEWHFFFF